MGPLTGRAHVACQFYEILMSHVSVAYLFPCPLSNLRNGHVKYKCLRNACYASYRLKYTYYTAWAMARGCLEIWMNKMKVSIVIKIHLAVCTWFKLRLPQFVHQLYICYILFNT